MSNSEERNIEVKVKTKQSNKIIDDEIDENPSFIKTLFASVIDQAIILGVSAIGLLIFDILIGFIGFMVKDPSGILLIIYIIFNILYRPIFERGNRRTIGKRILAIG